MRRQLLVAGATWFWITAGLVGTTAFPSTSQASVTEAQASFSSAARVPIVRQALRNNCETAALSMLLASRGVLVPQLELQRELPASGPLDPFRRDGVKIWGDPGRGFVGRARGGGTSGGYGVYQGPIAALAARHHMPLQNLSGGPVSRIYRSLRQGRPVLVWVALSTGPFQTWRTPQGRTIRANFGEHTVVLTGTQGNLLRVNDPIDGERKLWTHASFEATWIEMGRRALGLRAQ